MKSTGIVRKVDELGRIVIPVELRRHLGIEKKDPLEIYIEEEQIILQKYAPSCVFCGSTEDPKELAVYRNKKVCSRCLADLTSEEYETQTRDDNNESYIEGVG